MTTGISSVPVSIDYTDRDFYSLREALIKRVQERVPGWQGNDDSDFGVALIEAFSYVGDILAYYIDRVANENNLETATQRSNILALAKTYGYTPSSYQAASLTAQFINTSGAEVTIPQNTELITSISANDATTTLLFHTTADVVIPAQVGVSPGVVSDSLLHGELITLRATGSSTDASTYSVDGELLGVSSNGPSQQFHLLNSPVVEASVTILVGNNGEYSEWTEVAHLSDYGPTDTVYTLDIDADEFVTVTFGDGISGAIPPLDFPIRAKYTIGGGTIGNISSGANFNFYAVPVGSSVSVSDLNSAITTVTSTSDAEGGYDPESNEYIRQTAPLVVSANNRAVTLEDYTGLVLGSSICGKASATADIWTAVTMYIAPLPSDGVLDFFPLFDGTNTFLNATLWSELEDSARQALFNKTQIGVSVTFCPPTYVPIDMVVRYSKNDGYTSKQVKDALQVAVEQLLSYSSQIFNDTIRPEDIEQKLRDAVPGARTVQLETLARAGGSGRNILIGAANEIFVFNAPLGTGLTRTTITEYGTSSTLSGITVNTTPISTFAEAFLTYNASISGTTATIVLSGVTGGKVAYVNGTLYNGTSAVLTVPASPSTTAVSILVYAEDGVSTTTYTVNVSN